MNGITRQNNNKKNRAVIYCRVSTKEQVEEGNSLVTQERACRDYAQKYGYEIVEIYIEQGESAKTADRTELKKLLSFCASKKNDITAVIAYKIDRISRNTDDYSQIRMNLKRYGVEIKSTSEYFESSPAGRFMENIIANVAQFDNEVRTERSVGGMKGAVSEGRYVWMAPIGYSNVRDNGKATIAPSNQAHLVRKLFEEVALSKKSVIEINKELFKKGFSKTGKSPLATSNAYKILHDELYMGYINKFGLRVKGTFNPIISEELFSRVQRVLKSKRPKKHYEVNNPDFPLRRFITNEKGEQLTGAWSKGRSKYYGYYVFAKSKLNYNKDYLEGLFLTFLNTLSCNQAQIKYIEEKIRNHIEYLKNNISGVNNSIKERESFLLEKKQLVITKNLNGVYSDSTTKEQLEMIDSELWQIQSSRIKEEDHSIVPERVFKELYLLLKSPGEYWDQKSYAVKVKLQRFIFPKGLIISNDNLRTVEICRLYRANNAILDNISLMVPYRELNIELDKKPSCIQADDNLFEEHFQELKSELIELDKILFLETDQENISEYLYPSRAA